MINKITGRGGAGRGQGRKESENPRNIKKQIRWTEDEWTSVGKAAKSKGLSIADFQRTVILGACK